VHRSALLWRLIAQLFRAAGPKPGASTGKIAFLQLI